MDQPTTPPPVQRLYVIFNPLSGTASALGLTVANLQAKFQDAGLDAIVDPDDDQPLEARFARALASDADIIVAAGGDGTITSLARAVIDTGKTLAVLPLGTANLLARDLGVSLDLDTAIAELSRLSPVQIDVGEMNGRVFLHKAVIGTFPEIALERENVRSDGSLRARLKFAQAFLKRISDRRRIALRIEAVDAGRRRVERVKALAVANNAYDQAPGRFFARESLRRGELTLYIVKRLGFIGVVRLAVEMLMGRWHQDRDLSVEQVTAVILQMKKPRVQVMIDGEVEWVETPLDFRIRPLALSVLAPAKELS